LTVAEPAPTSYDELPYVGKAFAQTHPDRLATLGRLFGLQPPGLERCRVLELGCAGGDNLIPMALGLPNARFVGIDLSGRQIEHGQRQIGALGLTNIELRQYDITKVDASWGKFDYIISHGIYSWIPAEVRERLLAICRENLSANGVAYVSYNTLPGWHMKGMIRDMMIYHTAGFPGANAKVQQARGLLDFLARTAPANTPYGMMLREEAEFLRNERDAYLYHDHLEENNHAYYFHEFADAAKRNGLDYLAEADLSDMLVTNFPPEVAQTLQRVATDIVRMEQYMDFVRNRMFRQTLLVHEGAAIERKVDGRVVKGLFLNSAASPESAHPALAQGVSETFQTPKGSKHEVADALTKAALVVLASRWPACVPFEELAAMAHARLKQDLGDAPIENDDEKSFGDRMLQGHAARVVELRVAAPRLAVVPSERPLASPLARLQAESSTTLTNLRHELVVVPELPRRMLMLLDGTRDFDTLAAEIVKLAREGKIGVREQDGGPVVTDHAKQEQILRTLVADNLPKLVRTALLLE